MLALVLVENVVYAVVLVVVAAFIIWRHRENIARLRAGTEGRIGKKTTG